MAMLGAAVTLPVEKAAEVVDFRARTCPAKIASVSEVSVTPQVSGEILEVCFANGQTVAKGDVLYRLDPVKYIAAEKNAEAKVAEANARLFRPMPSPLIREVRMCGRLTRAARRG